MRSSSSLQATFTALYWLLSQSCIERSPTHRQSRKTDYVAASESTFSPVNFKCRLSWLVSFYALFKGWLPLSQPPSCPRKSTSFLTQVEFRVLIWRSGLFPSWAQELSSLALTAIMFSMVFGVWLDWVPFRAPNPISALPPRFKLWR